MTEFSSFELNVITYVSKLTHKLKVFAVLNFEFNLKSEMLTS